MISILLVDDQNLVQEGIKALLDKHTELKVIGRVKDAHNALKIVNALHPDIVLLDIEMPGMDGITATKHISIISPETKVIILTCHEHKKYITQALMAGAKGYLLKSSLMTDLKQAILAVNNGYSQVESRLLAKVFDPSNVKLKSKNSSKVNGDRSSERAVVKQDKLTVSLKSDPQRSLLTEEQVKAKYSAIKEANSSPQSNTSNGVKTATSLSKIDSAANVNFTTTKLPLPKITDTTPPIKRQDNNSAANSTTTESEVTLSKITDTNAPVNLQNIDLQLSQIAPEHLSAPLIPEVNRAALAIISESSAISNENKKPEKNQLLIRMIALKNHFQELIKKEKIARYKSQIAKYKLKLGKAKVRKLRRLKLKILQGTKKASSYKTSLVKYKSKFLSLMRYWQKKDVFSNIGLMLLGAALFYVIHAIF